MKILQLVKKFPNPPKDGEAIAVLSSSRGYFDVGCEVHLLSMNTKKHFADVNGYQEGLKHYGIVKTSYLDNSINLVKAFLNLFTSKSFNIQRFISPSFASELKNMLIIGDYDVVQLESLYMAPYIKTIKKHSKALVVMRSHNLEYEIWQNLSKSNKNPLLKWYYGLAARRLKSYELAQLNQYDLLLPISYRDHDKYLKLGCSDNILLSNVGIDLSKYTSNKSVLNSSVKLGYIGSLDWKPNVEGLKWFFEEVWNPIAKKFPNFEFHLAGRNPDASIKNLTVPSLVYHGEVENAKAFLEKLDIVIVPLLSGSGIRIKILESMAMGKVVLSTEKGFEGIKIEQGREGFVFKNLEDFDNSISELLSDTENLIEISNNAKQFIKDNFDYRSIAENNVIALKKIINNQNINTK